MASKQSIEQTPGQDAVELLMADHHRVAKLFAEFDALEEWRQVPMSLRYFGLNTADDSLRLPFPAA